MDRIYPYRLLQYGPGTDLEEAAGSATDIRNTGLVPRVGQRLEVAGHRRKGAVYGSVTANPARRRSP